MAGIEAAWLLGAGLPASERVRALRADWTDARRLRAEGLTSVLIGA